MVAAQGEVRISVVVPAFNEEKYLGATLTSLRRQDFTRPYEIIVVDNNSTDGTDALAESFGATVLHEPRPGVCAARQRGTAGSRGHIVVSTDADTVHPTDWLARIDAAFEGSDEVALVAGPCRYLEPSWWLIPDGLRRQPPHSSDDARYGARNPYPPPEANRSARAHRARHRIHLHLRPGHVTGRWRHEMSGRHAAERTRRTGVA